MDRQSTEKDRSFQENYVQVSAEMTEIYYSDFSKEDIIAFESYLTRIYNNLKDPETGN